MESEDQINQRNLSPKNQDPEFRSEPWCADSVVMASRMASQFGKCTACQNPLCVDSSRQEGKE